MGLRLRLAVTGRKLRLLGKSSREVGLADERSMKFFPFGVTVDRMVGGEAVVIEGFL